MAGDDRDFQRNSEEYRSYWSQRWRRTHTYPAQTKLKRFRSFAKPGERLGAGSPAVFDQGFGLGLMLFCFPRGSHLAGLELNQTAVDGATQEARRLGYTSTDLRVFVPEAPLPAEWKGAFDVVVSSHVLEHLSDPAGGVRWLASLLKPGGSACLVVPINEKPGEDQNHFSHFRVADFIQLVEANGFRVTDHHECDRLWHVYCPLAYSQQRHPTVPKRIASMSFNLLTAFLPAVALRMIDGFLGWFSVPTRQVFVLCQKRA